VAKDNFPHMLAVAEKIRLQFPDARFLIPTTPNTQPVVQRELARLKWAIETRTPVAGLQYTGTVGPYTFELDGFDRLVPQCDLCLTVSGTATLHVAGYHVPMIVVYRGNRILWHLIGRWIIKTRTYSLVNLLNDSHDKIVPEFVPWYGSDTTVADKAISFLKDPRQLDQQRRRLEKLIRSLDRPGASRHVAELAADLLRSNNETVVM
jgi:lipid-A-disaccharide synthase